MTLPTSSSASHSTPYSSLCTPPRRIRHSITSSLSPRHSAFVSTATASHSASTTPTRNKLHRYVSSPTLLDSPSRRRMVSPVSPLFKEPELPKQSTPALPNELYMHIFEFVGISELVDLRLISKNFKDLVNPRLLKLISLKIVDCERERETVDAKYKDIERQKRPHLRHYRQFLRGISTNEVTEATWYSSPPQELQTVCECLFILKGKSNDMSWSHLKKTMTKYEFKNWLTNLRVGVDYIPMKNIREAERVIMMDTSITYERLREVSMAGYKLLIIVAACLQYCNIAEELRVKGKELMGLEMKVGRARKYLECLV